MRNKKKIERNILGKMKISSTTILMLALACLVPFVHSDDDDYVDGPFQPSSSDEYYTKIHESHIAFVLFSDSSLDALLDPNILDVLLIFEQLSAYLEDVTFLAVDPKQLHDVASDLGVKNRQVFFVYIDGKIVEKWNSPSANDLAKLAKKYTDEQYFNNFFNDYPKYNINEDNNNSGDDDDD